MDQWRLVFRSFLEDREGWRCLERNARAVAADFDASGAARRFGRALGALEPEPAGPEGGDELQNDELTNSSVFDEEFLTEKMSEINSSKFVRVRQNSSLFVKSSSTVRQKYSSTFRQHFVNISSTCRQHVVNISSTFRQHFVKVRQVRKKSSKIREEIV